MSKKLIKEVPQRYCGDCSLGKLIQEHSNYDMQGKPIKLQCVNKEFQVLRSEKACREFKQKVELF